MTHTLAVTGGRDYEDRDCVFRWLDARLEWARQQGKQVRLVVGDAGGADAHAREWACLRHVDFVEKIARWDLYGNPAGPMRNKEIIDERPDELIAFPGGSGTRNCVAQARRRGVRVVEAR